MPQAAFFSNAMLTDKLKGSFGFTADMVFTLQVNANRFQAGRYMLTWLPLAGSKSTSTTTTASILSHSFSLVQRSQLPHVEIDLNCDTQVQLKVPFVSSESCISVAGIIEGDWDSALGIVRIYPYVPLATTAGSTDCKYTLWSHFENVRLTGQTIYQSNEWKPKMKGKKTISDREAEGAGLGPVSSISTKVSQTMSVLGKIPVLTPITSVAGWFADIVTDSAKIWGFSKPLNREHAHYMQRITASNFGNVDGAANFQPLALTTTQELEMLPGFAGTDEDEMSFAYLASKPSYLSTTTWTTSTAVNTNLLSLTINPSLMKSTVSDLSTTVDNWSPVGFISRFFMYWRGSIVYRFKIVKTEFHSGRLLLVFNPWDTRLSTIPTATISNSNTALRTVVDIREGNEFDIRIPYLAVQNYCLFNQSIGRLEVIVLDPLVAPATVSTSVSIITEVFAGDDIEFASPRNMVDFPYLPTAAQSGEWKPECKMLSETIGGATVHPTLNHARGCIGEKINSFRQLLKITTPIVEAAAVQAISTTKALKFYPWQWGYATNAVGLPIGAWFYPDYFTYMASIFVLMRGSVNLSASTKFTKHPILQIFVNDTTKNINTTRESAASGDVISNNVNMPVVYEDTNITSITGINVPFQNQYHSCNTSDIMVTGTRTCDAQHSPNTYVFFQLSDNIADAVRIFRSGGDDLSFGGFISIPPTVSTLPRAT